MKTRDREAMARRMFRRFKGSGIAGAPVAWFVAAEVDRAVRAERKAWRDTEELRASAIRRAEALTVEAAQNIGRKRT